MRSQRVRNFLHVGFSLALIGTLLWGTTGRASASRILYVNAAASGANNGTSWTNAYRDLQQALTNAVSGDEIWVVGGTYKPALATDISDPRTKTFALRNSVALYGGFAGAESLRTQRNPAIHVTVLSGDIGVAGDASDNAYHVVYASGVDRTAVLDGFTVRLGNANGSSFPKYYGGGLFSDQSSPTLSNLTFSNNSGNAGGGMTDLSGAPALTNITFSSNLAILGGGMFLVQSTSTLTNVTFSGNSASSAGGIFNQTGSPTLTNVTFSGNSTTNGIGNGIYNYSNGNASIRDSILWGDGAPEITNSSSAPTISNSIVQGGCPAGSVCSSVFNANPKLGPLANNGGFTKTRSLGAGSAAIDRGNGATCASQDQRGVMRPQGAVCDMGAYEVKVLSVSSVRTYDGWVLESGRGTAVGGSLNGTATTLRVGDDGSNRQFRSFLSFKTAGLPDAATVILAKLKLKKFSVTGTNPFSTHGSLRIDLAKPYFGTSLGLAASDFQAAATVSPAGSVSPVLSGGFYTGVLNSSGRANVNKTGWTQLRLYFSLSTNNDNGADYLSLLSGEAALSANRPTLIVYYNP